MRLQRRLRISSRVWIDDFTVLYSLNGTKLSYFVLDLLMNILQGLPHFNYRFHVTLVMLPLGRRDAENDHQITLRCSSIFTNAYTA